jgi:hypothetical protein
MLELAKRQEAIKGRQEATANKVATLLPLRRQQEAVSERLRHLPRASSRPVVVSSAPATPQAIFVPRAAVAPEKRIMRFELPKIAPRRILNVKRHVRRKKAKPGRAASAARQAPTIINIAAPKPQVINKIIRVKERVRPKKKSAPKTGRRIVTSGRTIININAPKSRVARKVVGARK